MFQRKFAPLVEKGIKKQTVRPRPKRTPKAGSQFSAREWTGKPYRSKQREIYSGVITKVESCEITETGVVVSSYAVPMDDFAKADGFADFFEMRDWFKSTHGSLPFDGIVIYWE